MDISAEQIFLALVVIWNPDRQSPSLLSILSTVSSLLFIYLLIYSFIHSFIQRKQVGVK